MVFLNKVTGGDPERRIRNHVLKQCLYPSTNHQKNNIHLVVYQFVDCVVACGIIVGINAKIKIKNKDLRQICLIFKYPINKDLENKVSVVS